MPPAPCYLHLDWIPLEEAMADDLKVLHGELPGEVGIADRTLDDKLWIVTASAAETPTTYHLYDRGKQALRELFSTRPDLKSYAWRRCTARSFARAMAWSCRPISRCRTASGRAPMLRCRWC